MDTFAQLNTALAGRYAIEREIGAGGMATVYLAHDLKHERHVAVKVLKPDLAAVLGAERFVQEIKTTAGLQHPHILPLFDSGTANGFLFYVMPWIQGETLRDKLHRETQLGVDEAVRIARDVADALDYAHRHGVIHRDIKPENILLHDGRPMVADFGIALAVSAAAGKRITETGLSLGTPHYMSPEQATAEKEITARSDVYSLGSVLYEMLTGNPPHVGASAQQIIMKIITEPAQPVTKHRKSVPPNVAAAVAKSLEKLPADRFESAKAFGDALANPAYTNAAAAGVAPAPATARRLRVMTAAGFTLAGAMAVAAAWWVSARHAEAPAAVHFSFSVAPNQPLAFISGRTVALSPDGRTVVFATADTTGRSRLFSRTLDDLRQQPIAGTEGGTLPFFSPDGRWIGFLDGGHLKKVPIEGGTPTALADSGVRIFGATWGTRGIVVSISGELALIPSGGGTPVPLAHGDSGPAYWPAVLPGGETVAYATALGMTAQLGTAEVSTGHTVNLGLPGVFPLGVAGGQLIFARGDGALMAVPFDERARRVTGTARVVMRDVQQNPTSGDAKAALSASGSLAYVGGTGLVQAVAVDMRGAARPLAVPPGRLGSPRYSPDGRRMAVDVTSSGRTDIWIYEVGSGAARRVTSDGLRNEQPEWTPDGTRLLFSSTRAGRNTLWWQPADGSGAAQLLVASPGKGIGEGVLAPDGRTVIYRTGSVETADIWYRRLSGDTTERPIATTPFAEIAPRVSPDGRWIAYQSNESGGFQVYVRPFPGPGAQVPVSITGGRTPIWSPDGRRLFFVNGTQLLAATVVTSPTFSVSAREVLFDGTYVLNVGGHASFDVSPDGKSFLMLRPMAGNSEEIVVIHNWKAELGAPAKSAGVP